MVFVASMVEKSRVSDTYRLQIHAMMCSTECRATLVVEMQWLSQSRKKGTNEFEIRYGSYGEARHVLAMGAEREPKVGSVLEGAEE